MPELTGPEDARADRGLLGGSRRDVVQGLQEHHARGTERRVEEAHKRGLKVTGHLCSVTYDEAVEIGHRQPRARLLREHRARSRQEARHVQRERGRRHARAHGARQPRGEPADRARSSSTTSRSRRRCRCFASSVPSPACSDDGGPAVRPAVLEAMSPSVREAYLYGRDRPVNKSPRRADALLLAPRHGPGARVRRGGRAAARRPRPRRPRRRAPGLRRSARDRAAGRGGFTPVQAIRIATLNGAIYLGRQDRSARSPSGRTRISS